MVFTYILKSNMVVVQFEHMADSMNSADFWRAIILYGRNTATYKLALAKALMSFVAKDQTLVTMEELAKRFLDLYIERLSVSDPRPQLGQPDRMTIMEKVVKRHQLGVISYQDAISQVASEAFTDVIPRFHTINNQAIDVVFFKTNSAGLEITDKAFEVLNSNDIEQLRSEVEGRWDLLEGAFLLMRGNRILANDVWEFYLLQGQSRTSLTKLVPVLQGYQNGHCFYCGEPLQGHKVEVDHMIPWRVINHNQVWNLVLAHRICNGDKSDFLPQEEYITKLVQRNERLIASNHPIRHEVIEDLGSTADMRARNTWAHYQNAKAVIRHTWQGFRGKRLEEDHFFRLVVRNLG